MQQQPDSILVLCCSTASELGKSPQNMQDTSIEPGSDVLQPCAAFDTSKRLCTQDSQEGLTLMLSCNADSHYIHISQMLLRKADNQHMPILQRATLMQSDSLLMCISTKCAFNTPSLRTIPVVNIAIHRGERAET